MGLPKIGGNLYVTDSFLGAIFKLPKGDAKITPWFKAPPALPPRTLPGLRGRVGRDDPPCPPFGACSAAQENLRFTNLSAFPR